MTRKYERKQKFHIKVAKVNKSMSNRYYNSTQLVTIIHNHPIILLSTKVVHKGCKEIEFAFFRSDHLRQALETILLEHDSKMVSFCQKVIQINR